MMMAGMIFLQQFLHADECPQRRILHLACRAVRHHKRLPSGASQRRAGRVARNQRRPRADRAPSLYGPERRPRVFQHRGPVSQRVVLPNRASPNRRRPRARQHPPAALQLAQRWIRVHHF